MFRVGCSLKTKQETPCEVSIIKMMQINCFVKARVGLFGQTFEPDERSKI